VLAEVSVDFANNAQAKTSHRAFLPAFAQFLSDLSMLAEVGALKTLTLDWMRNVTSLPSFAPLRQLESVAMETMKGLTSLEPIAAAPALRTLEIVNMPNLKAADFACLLGHRSLQTLRAFPGGQKVHMEIKQMFTGVAG
jgi:hypothetical protein